MSEGTPIAATAPPDNVDSLFAVIEARWKSIGVAVTLIGALYFFQYASYVGIPVRIHLASTLALLPWLALGITVMLSSLALSMWMLATLTVEVRVGETTLDRALFEEIEEGKRLLRWRAWSKYLLLPALIQWALIIVVGLVPMSSPNPWSLAALIIVPGLTALLVARLSNPEELKPRVIGLYLIYSVVVALAILLIPTPIALAVSRDTFSSAWLDAGFVVLSLAFTLVFMLILTAGLRLQQSTFTLRDARRIVLVAFALIAGLGLHPYTARVFTGGALRLAGIGDRTVEIKVPEKTGLTLGLTRDASGWSADRLVLLYDAGDRWLMRPCSPEGSSERVVLEVPITSVYGARRSVPCTHRR